MNFTFRQSYFLWFLLLFALEVLIALFTDNWIRAYFGDFLVVILLYCFIISFVEMNKKLLLTIVLLFSCVVEILQYYKFVELIGLQNSSIANTVIGTSFSWLDMLMYTFGILFMAIIEQLKTSSIFLTKSKIISNG
ncbi:ribosomal maturation YjgA family protein [Pedobacter cryotolerans]|uniref:DUF2809 domain-containing protein n=1 Tax=Pedobacter cryotolerans TaxID=2571270 RepID=A0A4U1BWY7_9SPHI|nr:DUF2809 domain-containing protein [Pedobacter cryotolerans]TKB97141.1 DUF2809 domain-containing protein [Pedobacter cryotolerans]